MEPEKFEKNFTLNFYTKCFLKIYLLLNTESQIEKLALVDHQM